MAEVQSTFQADSLSFKSVSLGEIENACESRHQFVDPGNGVYLFIDRMEANLGFISHAFKKLN